MHLQFQSSVVVLIKEYLPEVDSGQLIMKILIDDILGI